MVCFIDEGPAKNIDNTQDEKVEVDNYLESIFPDNEKINVVLNKYNLNYPDEKITSDIVLSGTQMGRGGNSVVHFTYKYSFYSSLACDELIPFLIKFSGEEYERLEEELSYQDTD